MDQAPPPSQPPSSSLPADVVQKSQEDVQSVRDVAALSYVWILSVIIFFVRRDSAFAQFHARQAMVLFVLSILFWFLPFVGRFLDLLILGLCALGFLSAAQGQWRELPLVGPLLRWDLHGAWISIRHPFTPTPPTKSDVPPQPQSAQQ